MRRLVLLLSAFAYMVLLIEAVRAAAAWWRGEAAPTASDIAFIAALPLLAWIWFRHLSVFRKGCGKDARAVPPSRAD